MDALFVWPEGRSGAVSFTFDDARGSQIDFGIDLLAKHNVLATFYVSFAGVSQRLHQWKQVAADGHEIGNHSLYHPCTANYQFSRAAGACTEDYSLEQITAEIEEANRRIEDLLAVTPRTFAYPCGETHVGRGAGVASYVPVVAERFLAGRGYHHDHPNDPRYCDLAHLLSFRFDIQPWEQHTVALEGAKASGEWIIFSGHETGGPEEDFLNITRSDFERVLAHLDELRNDLWVAPVAEVADWIAGQRSGESKDPG